MKKIYSLMIGLLFVGSSFAQTYEVKATSTPIVVDGVIEGTWASASEALPLEKDFQVETPSVTATWQALWDNENFYVVVSVEDEDHWPSWEVAGGNSWQYDKVEVYIDANPTIADAGGPSVLSTGHYQVAPAFAEATYDVETAFVADGRTPGGSYAFHLNGENYVAEYALQLSTITSVDGVAETPAILKDKGIGFDVIIIDQDEAATTSSSRKAWNQDGKTTVMDQPWINMNDCGVLSFTGDVSNKTLKNAPMSVYPNPVIDNVTINADFNNVSISNILGQEIKTLTSNSKTINVSDLSKGVYIIKAYKNKNYVGVAKINKK